MTFDVLIWFLTGGLILVGLAGVVIPLLPGTTLILAAVALHKLLLPESLSWWTVGGVAVLWAVSVATDFLCTLLAVRVGGGSRWGMAAAGAGALAGMLVSVPAVILGSVLGAGLAERLLARKSGGAALQAGLFAGLGFLVGVLVRVILALGMILWFVLDAATRGPRPVILPA